MLIMNLIMNLKSDRLSKILISGLSFIRVWTDLDLCLNFYVMSAFVHLYFFSVAAFPHSHLPSITETLFSRFYSFN